MNEVEKYIRSIPDFPEPGIIFRDITTVTQDPKGLKIAIDSMLDKIKDIDFWRNRWFRGKRFYIWNAFSLLTWKIICIS